MKKMKWNERKEMKEMKQLKWNVMKEMKWNGQKWNERNEMKLSTAPYIACPKWSTLIGSMLLVLVL